MGCHWGVRMPDQCRRQEDGRARQKADDEAQVPEHKVPALVRIVAPQGGDGAFAPGHISPVTVGVAVGLWAKVNRRGGERGASKVSAEPGVALGELVQVFLVRVVDAGEVCLKKIYGGKVWAPARVPDQRTACVPGDAHEAALPEEAA
jgi:hypothetical protein